MPKHNHNLINNNFVKMPSVFAAFADPKPEKKVVKKEVSSKKESSLRGVFWLFGV